MLEQTDGPYALLVSTREERVVSIILNTMADYQMALGGSLEVAHVFENGDTLYVDADREHKEYCGKFRVNGVTPKMDFIRGNALILGKDGESMKTSKIGLKSSLSFQYIV